MDERDGVPLPDEYVVDADVKPRVSMDKIVNACGERLIDTCIATGLKIVNGRFGDDEGIGRLTCNTYNGGSVIDYVLTESTYFPHLANFKVWDPLLVSDHCPIQLEVLCQSIEHSIGDQQHTIHLVSKERFKLDVTKMDTFLEELNKQDRVQALGVTIVHINVTESSKVLEDHIRQIGLD